MLRATVKIVWQAKRGHGSYTRAHSPYVQTYVHPLHGSNVHNGSITCQLLGIEVGLDYRSHIFSGNSQRDPYCNLSQNMGTHTVAISVQAIVGSLGSSCTCLLLQHFNQSGNSLDFRLTAGKHWQSKSEARELEHHHPPTPGLRTEGIPA